MTPFDDVMQTGFFFTKKCKVYFNKYAIGLALVNM